MLSMYALRRLTSHETNLLKITDYVLERKRDARIKFCAAQATPPPCPRMQGWLVGIPLWQSARIVRPAGNGPEDVVCANGGCYASAMAGNRGRRRERVRSVSGFGVRHIDSNGAVYSGPCSSVIYPNEMSDARVPVGVVRFQGRLRTSASL